MKIIICLSAFLLIATAQAIGFSTQEKGKINEYLSLRQYETAARFISSNKHLMDSPEALLIYTTTLVDYYLTTISYKLFALKDLEDGEQVNKLRGKKGKFQIIGGDLEKILHEKSKSYPENPHLNLAIGYYLSKGFACQCLKPEFFSNDTNQEFEYFDKAYQQKVFNYWSLFRLGFFHHSKGDTNKAIHFYELSFKENPDHIPNMHNLAIIHLNSNNLQKALFYSNTSKGKYEDNSQNADTYHLNGIINWELKEMTKAEDSLTKALELLNYHQGAFKSLLQLYREQKKEDEYVKTVNVYLANDYSNTYYFNQYIDFIQNSDQHSFELAVFDILSKTKIQDLKFEGPFYFNLGRLALDISKQKEAIVYFNRSLKYFKSIKNPPEGAIDALNNLISQAKTIKN